MLLTPSSWKYNHLRQVIKNATPTISPEGIKRYTSEQTRPITAPSELALIHFHRLFVQGHDRERCLCYRYGDTKRTCHNTRIDIRQHLNGTRVFGVYPDKFTRFIRFDIDAHTSDRLSWCIKMHQHLCDLLKNQAICYFQQLGPTGTNIFCVFSNIFYRAGAEQFCQSILAKLTEKFSLEEVFGIEYFPHGNVNCTLPLRFDRETILEKPIGLETYTYRGKNYQRVSVKRFMDWLSDPDREYGDVDEEFLRSIIRPPKPRANRKVKIFLPEQKTNATDPKKTTALANKRTGNRSLLGPQQGVATQNYIDFWMGNFNAEDYQDGPSLMQMYLGMTRRYLFAYGLKTEEIQNILITFIEELPDTSFCDHFTCDCDAFFFKLHNDTKAMKNNGRQSDIVGSKRILERLVTKWRNIGFDPSDKSTWCAWMSSNRPLPRLIPSSTCVGSLYSSPLPEEMLLRLNAVKGRNKVERFAGVFLNYLKKHDGVAYISQRTFYAMLGYKDAKQVCKYKTIIRKAGLILYDPDKRTGYIPKRQSKRYVLTECAEELFGRRTKANKVDNGVPQETPV
jgi:hypothetical protein